MVQYGQMKHLASITALILPACVYAESMVVPSLPEPLRPRSEAETNVTFSAAAGADVWVPVYKGNKCVDRAQMSEFSSPWGAGGSMTWPIPNEYARLQGNSEGTYFCNTDQSFFVDTDGTSRLEKFGWFAEVTTNRVFNYGRTASP